ncbi:Rho guanine nucleotide exchange factor 37 [Paragonimus heterotremus]|uniref:Rho guanine nucleotide exchange factor 37 n=1 Tax=Paragonimus heterotremus TaxID=100268 RepID=A0A8J4TRS8_9TREM|nr:Rho guanine nucleotide exchange factor 37 [Paragonimus heterotremus]
MFHPGHSVLNDDASATASATSDETNTKPSKRGYLIQELVTTQMHFATDLTQLNTVLNNVSVKLKDEDRLALLVNLPEVAQVSMELYKCWNQELLKYSSTKCEDAHIALATLPFKDRLNKEFFLYSANYDVNTVQKNANMEAFVLEAISSMKVYKPFISDLNSELIKPVQRIVKYEQLFSQLKDTTPECHPDYQATCDLYENFRGLLRRANEDKRWNDILSEVFDEHNKPRRRRNSSKSLRRVFDSLRHVQCMPSDPKLAHEKWKLDNLRTAAEKLHIWIEKRFDFMRRSLVTECDFLNSVINMCDSNGNIALHSRIGPKPSTSPILLESVRSHANILDSTLAYFAHTVKPKVENGLLRRLEDLLDMLQDPGLLIEELQKTEKDLSAAETQVYHAQVKNQPCTTLTERRDELVHTRDTLRGNLLKQMPKLIDLTENFLLATLSYTFRLSALLWDRHGSMTQKELITRRHSSFTGSQMTTEEFTVFIDGIQERLKSKPTRKFSSPHFLNVSASAATSNFGLSRSSIRRTSAEVSPKLREALVTNINSLVRSQTYYPSSVGLKPPSASNQSNSLNRASSDSRCSEVSRQIRAVYQTQKPVGFLEVGQPSNSTAQPTHQATYSYTARNENEVSMEVGQFVVLIEGQDSVGNTEWCKVIVLPSHKTGYVPANRLRPISSE